MAAPASVDEYIASFEPEVRDILTRLRAVIADAVPGSDDTIRYGMPAAMSDGHYVVHYAAWKHHIGLYPIPVMPEALEAEVAPYRSTKDTIKLPYRSPIPYELIGRLATALARRHADERARAAG